MLFFFLKGVFFRFFNEESVRLKFFIEVNKRYNVYCFCLILISDYMFVYEYCCLFFDFFMDIIDIV